MKIIIINRYFYPDHSATSQLLSDLAFFLSGRSFEVIVITSRQQYDNPRAKLPVLEDIKGVHVVRVWSSRFGRDNLFGRAIDYATFYITTAWRLLLLLRAGDIVIAKTDPPLIGSLAAPIVAVRGATLINWIQDLFPDIAITLGTKILGGKVGRALRRMRNKSFKYAAINVVIGEQMAERIIEAGVKENNVEIIHNWADGENIYRVPQRDNPFRKDWGLQGKFVVGYSGNMGRAHEFETVLGAAERLQENDDIWFLFIGDGAKRQWIEKHVKKSGLSNVIFQPYQERESLAYSLSVPDIHLISLWPELEGLIVPSKSYGIVAVGRPAIYVGNDEGEIPRILRECQCGWTVAQGDAERLVQYIRQLKGDPVLAKEMGDRARAVFEERFDKKHAMAKWEKILMKVGGIRGRENVGRGS